MLWYTALQLAVAAWAAATLARGAHLILYVAPVDVEPFARGLEARLRAGARESAEALAQAIEPAWAGALTRLVLRTERPLREGEIAVELSGFRARASRPVEVLRALATISGALGLLGAVLAAIDLYGGERGLEGLLAGLPERLATERALLAIGIGLGSSVALHLAVRALRAEAVRTLRGLERVARLLLDAPPGPAGGGERPPEPGDPPAAPG